MFEVCEMGAIECCDELAPLRNAKRVLGLGLGLGVVAGVVGVGVVDGDGRKISQSAVGRNDGVNRWERQRLVKASDVTSPHCPNNATTYTMSPSFNPFIFYLLVHFLRNFFILIFSNIFSRFVWLNWFNSVRLFSHSCDNFFFMLDIDSIYSLIDLSSWNLFCPFWSLY